MSRRIMTSFNKFRHNILKGQSQCNWNATFFSVIKIPRSRVYPIPLISLRLSENHGNHKAVASMSLNIFILRSYILVPLSCEGLPWHQYFLSPSYISSNAYLRTDSLFHVRVARDKRCLATEGWWFDVGGCRLLTRGSGEEQMRGIRKERRSRLHKQGNRFLQLRR